jgi:hypothetical protein
MGRKSNSGHGQLRAPARDCVSVAIGLGEGLTGGVEQFLGDDLTLEAILRIRNRRQSESGIEMMGSSGAT